MRHNSMRSTLPTAGRIAVVATTIAGLLALAPTAADASTAHHKHRHHHHHSAAKKKHHLTVVKGHKLHQSKAAHEAAVRGRKVVAALDIAIHHEGAPYVYGASGPSSFDCSGLTSYAYHHAGFPGLPRTAAEQSAFVHRIPRSAMQKGDFVFFYDGGGVYHVGLYDGMVNGVRYIVHAPYPGESVKREAIWTDSWFAGTLR